MLCHKQIFTKSINYSSPVPPFNYCVDIHKLQSSISWRILFFHLSSDLKLLDEVKETWKDLGLRDRANIQVTTDDVLHIFPQNVAVHYDDSGKLECISE